MMSPRERGDNRWAKRRRMPVSASRPIFASKSWFSSERLAGSGMTAAELDERRGFSARWLTFAEGSCVRGAVEAANPPAGRWESRFVCPWSSSESPDLIEIDSVGVFWGFIVGGGVASCGEGSASHLPIPIENSLGRSAGAGVGAGTESSFSMVLAGSASTQRADPESTPWAAPREGISAGSCIKNTVSQREQ